MNRANPDISVVLCTKDRPREVRRFFASLDSQSMPPGQVVVVDASAGRETARFIGEKAAAGADYSLEYAEAVPGTARQRNMGICLSRGKYIYYFDDDVVLERDYLLAAHRTFEALDGLRLGGVTGRITNLPRPKASLDSFSKKLFFLTSLGKGRIKPSGLPEHRIGAEPAFVEVLAGACMAFPREALEKARFDETLTGYSYMEDVDISRRLFADGYKLFYQPEARLAHFSATSGRKSSRDIRRMFIRNHCYFFRKNSRKDISHTLAFAWSVFGVIFVNLVFLRDFRAVRGVLEGLRDFAQEYAEESFS